jgi:FHA domain
MDRTVALAVEQPSSPATVMHLRLAEPVPEGDGPTRVFTPDCEPAPTTSAEQARFPMDDLIDVDQDDVREVLEGRLELEPSRPGARVARRNTVVSQHVERPPLGAGTQIVATALREPIAEGTQIVATRLREPAVDGTQVFRTVMRAPASVVAPPSSASPVVAPTPVTPAAAAPGVPIAIPSPRRVASTASETSVVRMMIAGRYLGDAIEGDAVCHELGASLVLGRAPGSPFADDPYVDAQHAALTFRPDGVVIDDFDSTNGVLVRVRGTMALRSGDHFRIGEELLRYTAIKTQRTVGRAPAFGSPDPGYWGRIDVLLTSDDHAAAYPIDDIDVTLGQTEGHLQFPDDPFLSPLHARIVKQERGAALEDLGSDSGTWLRLRSGDVVPYGSELLVGGTRIVLDRG